MLESSSSSIEWETEQVFLKIAEAMRISDPKIEIFREDLEDCLRENICGEPERRIDQFVEYGFIDPVPGKEDYFSLGSEGVYSKLQNLLGEK